MAKISTAIFHKAENGKLFLVNLVSKDFQLPLKTVYDLSYNNKYGIDFNSIQPDLLEDKFKNEIQDIVDGVFAQGPQLWIIKSDKEEENSYFVLGVRGSEVINSFFKNQMVNPDKSIVLFFIPSYWIEKEFICPSVISFSKGTLTFVDLLKVVGFKTIAVLILIPIFFHMIFSDRLIVSLTKALFGIEITPVQIEPAKQVKPEK